MTTEEHLLACLAEECIEVAKEAHKALRFGITDRNPLIENAPNQRAMIIGELNDLAAVVEMLTQRGILPADWTDLKARDAKKAKVLHYMEYARERGALND